MYKGIEKNQNYTWLICAAQNMKNIVTKITKGHKKRDTNNKSRLKSLKNILLDFKIAIFPKNIKSPRKNIWGLSIV